MIPTCPRGTNLLESYDECGYPCPAGYEPTTQDDLYCVGTVCPVSSTVDNNNNVICNKTYVAKTGSSCPVGTTEWETLKCYTDCPPTFNDSGTKCLKPTLKRKTAQLQCNYLYVLNGTTCDLSTSILFSIILIIFLTIAFMFSYARSSSNCKTPKFI